MAAEATFPIPWSMCQGSASSMVDWAIVRPLGSGKHLTDILTDQSDWGNFSTEVPPSQVSSDKQG